MIAHSRDPAMRPSPVDIDHQTGERRPSLWAHPRDSGINLKPLSWPEQHRLLMTIRRNAQFRYELLRALGLWEVAR